jgi:hypothetical protein
MKDWAREWLEDQRKKGLWSCVCRVSLSLSLLQDSEPIQEWRVIRSPLTTEPAPENSLKSIR